MADNNWEKITSFRNTDIPTWLPVLVGAAFIYAAWFFYTNKTGKQQGPHNFVMKPEYYDTAPVRTLKNRLETQGMPCGDCHDPAGPSSNDPTKAPEVHSQIVLNHGSNNHCFNCHNNGSRNFFAGPGGAKVPYAHVEMLCGKCHGNQYRDWERGTHGRRNGYWNKAMGEQKALVCIACHNPHDPKFKPLTAAPQPQAYIDAALNGQIYATPGEKH